MPSEKWIFFDIDGTLLNTVDVHADAIQEYLLKEYNFKANRKKVASYFGLTSGTFFKKLSSYVFNTERRDWDLQLMHIKYLREGLESGKLKIKVLPGVSSAISKLSKNYKLGVLTGNIPVLGKLLLKNSGLSKSFSVAYFSEKEIVRRSQLVYKAKIKARGQLIIVGDTLEDLKAAEENSVVCVCVTTGVASSSEFKKAGAKYIIKNMNELPSVLKKLDF